MQSRNKETGESIEYLKSQFIRKHRDKKHCIRRMRRRLTGHLAGETDCLAPKMKRAFSAPVCPDGATKFANASLSELVLGQPAAAALGICHYMRVAEADVGAGMAAGVESIVQEVTTNGSAVDVECLGYVLNKACGQSSLAFQNGLKRDCGADGTKTADGAHCERPRQFRRRRG